MICKICGKNAESEYCFRHKPKKSLSIKQSGKKESTDAMRSFFLKIWSVRPHYSQLSNTYLGKEPLSVFFHHILPKEKFPEAMFDEENIVLLTLDEHSDVERSMYKFEKINNKRIYLQTKYKPT